ncbi:MULTISPECIES: thioesterase II family protein [unclassified Streptomyces]|uniref:thioesterase II family protein n=1 Tax=unclassified Streptomyces TaxID=2593676 RepID=UPI00166104CC|nr:MULTISPECIES: thioesterase domain-containing protein [unclassified Streptomyces]MBD0708857.1 hypothetical protein [Streptomyces sp. CBMA291]MBD0717009.1 hypothetical protein [Streptomyces sp. CBMA370]
MKALPGGWYDMSPPGMSPPGMSPPGMSPPGMSPPGGDPPVPEERPRGPYALLFPFAGGNIHSMREWITELGPGWRPLVAQYPRRGRRLRTPMPAALTDLGTELADAFLEFAPGERPLLLGHSLGAHLAHTAAVRFEERGVTPRLLAVAASRTAGGGATAADTVPLHQRSDADLVDALGRFGGMPEALADPRFAQLFLPVVRADLRLGHDHLAGGYDRTVHCPVLAVGGTEDPLAVPDDVARWSKVAAGDFALELVAGGHFFQQRGGTGLRARFDRVLTGPARHPHHHRDEREDAR